MPEPTHLVATERIGERSEVRKHPVGSTFAILDAELGEELVLLGGALGHFREVDGLHCIHPA